MYEDNLKPLPPGDASQVFAELLASLRSDPQSTTDPTITPDTVDHWANPQVQAMVGQACRRLLLPGSGIVGLENLSELIQHVRDGDACLICLNHRSNLDVPTLYALLADQQRLDLFDPIVWIAGRKLQEDAGLTPVLVEGFNRIVVTPKSWLNREHSAQELRQARRVNWAAHRAIHNLRHRKWVFGLFPAGTRARPDDESTTQALEETDSFIKYCEFMLPAFIDGCTLPVTHNHDLTHETPQLDRMRYLFGQVVRTDSWRASATRRFPQLPQRAASARAIMDDINALRPGDSNDHDASSVSRFDST